MISYQILKRRRILEKIVSKTKMEGFLLIKGQIKMYKMDKSKTKSHMTTVLHFHQVVGMVSN